MAQTSAGEPSVADLVTRIQALEKILGQRPGHGGKSAAKIPPIDTSDARAAAPAAYGFLQHLKHEILGSVPTPPDPVAEASVTATLTFLNTPLHLEQCLTLGFLQCLEAFLYVFTVLPLRCLVACVCMFPFLRLVRGKGLTPQQLYSMVQVFVLLVCCVVLVWLGQISVVYHWIRGEAFIKLYVIFNALETLDKLCCVVGQDSTTALYNAISASPIRVHRLLVHLLLNIIYVLVHAVVLFVELVCLNVAVNSHTSTLLTLLLSSNFGEVKGSVFKRFVDQNVFQICCSDALERFQITIFLVVIMMQDAQVLTSFDQVWPVVVVLTTELFVDWMKHLFIAKFNGLASSKYDEFTAVLCHDTLKNQREPLDPTRNAARRLGLATIPMCCLVVRFVYHGVEAGGLLPRWWTITGLTVFGLLFAVVFALKQLISLMLLAFARHKVGAAAENVEWAEVYRYSLLTGRIPL